MMTEARCGYLGWVHTADLDEFGELELGPVLRLVDLLREVDALDRRQLV
jgi:hypothetical protein